MKNLLQKNICKILFPLLALIPLLAFRATPLNACRHSVIPFQRRRGKIPNSLISAVVSALVCNERCRGLRSRLRGSFITTCSQTLGVQVFSFLFNQQFHFLKDSCLFLKSSSVLPLAIPFQSTSFHPISSMSSLHLSISLLLILYCESLHLKSFIQFYSDPSAQYVVIQYISPRKLFL